MQDTVWDATGDIMITRIADLPRTERGSDWMTEQANARLIAAAPEMFEALKALLDAVSSWQKHPAKDAASTAIAKAGGPQ